MKPQHVTRGWSDYVISLKIITLSTTRAEDKVTEMFLKFIRFYHTNLATGCKSLLTFP